MILEIFTILFIISLIMIALGQYLEADVLKVFGFFLWFMIGLSMTSSGLEYKAGDNITEVGLTTVVTPNYNVYYNNIISVFIAIVGIMGMTLTLVDHRNARISED
jgi:hypothetical protein